MSDFPFLNPSFEIRWGDLDASRVVPDMQEGIRRANANIQAISELPAPSVTWETTFAALEAASTDLDAGWGKVMHLASVADSPELRAAIAQAMPEVSAYYSSITLNPELWSSLKNFASREDLVAGLTPVQTRYLDETVKSFKEGGADLPPDQKLRVSEIHAQLADLTRQFSEKVLDSTNAWELVVTDPAELDGLPESALAAARADAQSKGLGSEENPVWRFTLQVPSMLPVMQFARNAELRRKVWEASCNVGTGEYDTAALVSQIVALRDEKARILGFASYADQATSRRMAKTGQNALDFIEQLHHKVQPSFLTEIEDLQAYKQEKTGDATLQPWDVAYWSELQRQDLYAFDDEALRPYFPMAGVLEGMFDIASTLFGIQVEKIELDPALAWHPEVEFFRVSDTASGEHLGSFYTDWYPRETKRGGAWMNCLACGLPPIGGKPRIPHLGLMCGNMSRPVNGKPALLTHAEVETVFHEFGHLLHQLLSNVEIKALSGTNVAWDFVELPSQILENWCWNRQSVDLFARHYLNSGNIPDELFTSMTAARNYQSAMTFMRQLMFGKLDLELHLHPALLANATSLDDLDRQLLADYRIPFPQHPPSMARRFGHLFSDPDGYAAGYYSYKWAEVLDADAFTRFEKEGILNPATGQAFRACILSRGNSAPPDQLYREFMGRDPDPSALLVRSGIAAGSAS